MKNVAEKSAGEPRRPRPNRLAVAKALRGHASFLGPIARDLQIVAARIQNDVHQSEALSPLTKRLQSKVDLLASMITFMRMDAEYAVEEAVEHANLRTSRPEGA